MQADIIQNISKQITAQIQTSIPFYAENGPTLECYCIICLRHTLRLDEEDKELTIKVFSMFTRDQ